MGHCSEIKEEIQKRIEQELPSLTALSDDLADHPEVSGAEYETAGKIVRLLADRGFRTQMPYAGLDTAFQAVYGGDSHRHKAAVLVEFDALPELGHACGHNLSAAISLLAGIALSGVQDALDCDIHLIGTPAEETEGAKCKMCDLGIFRGYDMAMMLHLYDQNLIYCTLNGLACMLYTFHGKSTHAGATPWEGQNALNAAQLMLHGIDCIRGCCTPDSRINSVIYKGGAAAGIIPEEAQVETWVRSPDFAYLEKLIERVDNCAKGGALMAECTYDRRFTADTYKNLRRNRTGEGVIQSVYQQLGLEINGDHGQLFGSSDIGNVSFECPAFHPTLQLVDRGVAIHTREFAAAVKGERAHRCVADGAKIIAYTIAELFSDEEKLRQMKAEFQGQ